MFSFFLIDYWCVLTLTKFYTRSRLQRVQIQRKLPIVSEQVYFQILLLMILMHLVIVTTCAFWLHLVSAESNETEQ